MHANEPLPRERLIEELWGDAAPKTVHASLSVYLSRLRRLLADGTGEQVLLTHATGYVLKVRADELDARRFESLLDQGRRELSSGEAERASATLQDALALWRGPALADLAFQPFAQTEIARLEELRLTALEGRIEADLALGRQDALVAELETLVAEHPYREGLRAQLMLALYRSGRQAEALETYRRARRVFSEELGIEPGRRLQELEGAILRQDSSLEGPHSRAPRTREEEQAETVPEKRRLPTRWALAVAGALGLVIAAAVVAAVRESSGRSSVPVQLAGESVAVIDPRTDTIVGEIPVGGRPSGPAVGEGSVWVGNRDNETILRIDPSSREVVKTIGLPVAPTDVEVGAGGVWVLSSWAVLRIDPAINDVVAKIPLPRLTGRGPWTNMEVGASTVYVCRCFPIPGDFARIDAVTTDLAHFVGPVARIAYGEDALWTLTGHEAETIDRFDSETHAVVGTIPLGRIGELHAFRGAMTVGEGAIWLASHKSLWRIDPVTGRVQGSVPLGIASQVSIATGHGAVWAASYDHGVLLRVDPTSYTVAKTIRLGTLIYPANLDPTAVGEGAVWMAVTSYAS